MAPFKSPKRTRGEFPSTPDIDSFRLEELRSLRNRVRCTWLRHESSASRDLTATAPYCREARVTFAWRQTACQMRHCCARRIVETGSRRKLGCTSTRWAERHPQGVYRIRKAAKPPTAAQQRIVGAGANRIAMLNAASPRAGSAIGKHCSSSSCSLAMGIFSGRV